MVEEEFMASYFKTIDEQMELLMDKGLLITDAEVAKEFLLKNHFERLKGYMDAFMMNDRFIKGTTLEDIMDAYLFDHELRHILLLHLETIEVNLKSVYCYEFSKVHGSTGYLDHSFYSDPVKHQEVLDKVDKQRAKLAKHDPHYRHVDNNGTKIDLPIPTCIELFTIKDITNLYILSERSIKRKVALSLGLTFKKRDVALGRMMLSLTYLRNLCAHGKRIYNVDSLPKLFLNKKDADLLKNIRLADWVHVIFSHISWPWGNLYRKKIMIGLRKT